LHVEASRESLDRLEREIVRLRASRRRLAVAEDAERRRLERELHDGPQQRLFALAVDVQLARELVQSDPVGTLRILDELGRDVQRALDETASLAQRIYPPLLESGGLADALRAAAVGVGARVTIDVDRLDGCPHEHAGATYFCCLELLERAGEGALAEIGVRRLDGGLTFEIAASPVAESALGELGDRVEALGGTLATTYEPGDTVRVSGSFGAGG
jgi:hypothetical protein